MCLNPPMSESSKPLLFLFAGVLVGTLGLWLLIGQFLGSTDDMAATLASRAALSRSQSGPVQPLSAGAQRKAELQSQVSINATPLQKPDASDSSDRAPSVKSALAPAEAERADSDEDIETRKSIEQLEQELAGDGLLVDELIGSTPDTVLGDGEEATLSVAMSPFKQGAMIAHDVSLDLADQCKDRRADGARVGVQFRPGSSAIKGRSLGELDLIVEAARKCELSVVVVEALSPSVVDGDRDLAERRADEIKYYLLQRGIDKELMRFQDRS